MLAILLEACHPSREWQHPCYSFEKLMADDEGEEPYPGCCCCCWSSSSSLTLPSKKQIRCSTNWKASVQVRRSLSVTDSAEDLIPVLGKETTEIEWADMEWFLICFVISACASPAPALQIPIQLLFKKKIPMQQWRKLRPVSIDGFMALNIINFTDRILLIW